MGWGRQHTDTFDSLHRSRSVETEHAHTLSRCLVIRKGDGGVGDLIRGRWTARQTSGVRE